MNTYSEILIFYFSGTGNSKQVTRWILEFAAAIFTPILSFGSYNGLIKFTMVNLMLIGFLFGFYHLQHFILRKKIIGRFIVTTSLTYYRFWGRYKSIPDCKWKK